MSLPKGWGKGMFLFPPIEDLKSHLMQQFDLLRATVQWQELFGGCLAEEGAKQFVDQGAPLSGGGFQTDILGRGNMENAAYEEAKGAASIFLQGGGGKNVARL
jgi:hypothetical protein